MIADAALAGKPRCRVAYRTRVEYSTANPSVAKIWTKNSAAVPSGIRESRLFQVCSTFPPRAARPRPETITRELITDGVPRYAGRSVLPIHQAQAMKTA